MVFNQPFDKANPQYIVYDKKYDQLQYHLIPSSAGFIPNMESLLANDWMMVRETTKVVIEFEE